MTTSTSASKPTTVGGENAGARRNQLIAIGLLVGWTFLVWIGRVRNVLADDDLAGFAKAWRLGVALGFVAAGLVLAALVASQVKKSGPASLARPSSVGSFASLLAIVGIAWWLIRGGGILLADFDTSFKIVHTVLAVVTFGLSGLVLMATRSMANDR